MKYVPKFLVFLILVVFSGQLALTSPPGQKIIVSGALSGRISHAPLAKAWVGLGRLAKDANGQDAVLSLTEFNAVTDEKGNFQIKEVPTGTYTLVYRPAPASAAKAGLKIPVSKLSAAIHSFMPMIRDREVGVSDPFPERPWTAGFSLMNGHTLYCQPLGTQMTIWNASVRSGRQGPFLEMRRNKIWSQDFQRETQLKFEAWSF